MESKLTQLAKQRSAAKIQMLSKDSLTWFKTKVNNLKNPSSIANAMEREQFRKTRFGVGRLFFFFYDPRGKNDLPYYDMFPLVLTLERYDDSFLGLNLHYLPVKWRLAFLGKLMDYAIRDEDGIKRLRITYDIINASRRFREFQPCIKKYLLSGIRSKILTVGPNEWDIASYLPVHRFKGAKPQEIWKDSIREIKAEKEKQEEREAEEAKAAAKKNLLYQ